MRKLLSLLAGLMLLAVTLAPPARAQMMMGGEPHARMFTFGIGGGVAVPVSDAKDALKNGFNGIAYARTQLPGMPISFGVQVAFQRFDLKTASVSTSTPGVPSPSGNASLLAGMGEAKVNLMRGPIQPYVTVGLGAYNVHSESDAGGTSTSDTRFGLNGGAGLSVRLASLRAFVQGRIDNVYTSNGGFTNANSIQVVPVTLGLEY